MSGEPGNANNNPADVFSGLNTDNLSYVRANGFKDLDGAITKTRELESIVGKSFRHPGEDASPEDVSKYLGRALEPFKDSPIEAYDFGEPQLSDGASYDVDTAQAFKESMREMGMPPQIAKQVHDWYVGQANAEAEFMLAEAQGMADDATVVLQQAWGAPDSATFKANQELVTRAIQNMGGDDYKDALIEAGAIDDEDNILNAALIMPLAKIGESLSEDSFESGYQSTGKNPFSDEDRNYTEQQNLIKNDPDTARSLIRAAGKDPKSYRL